MKRILTLCSLFSVISGCGGGSRDDDHQNGPAEDAAAALDAGAAGDARIDGAADNVSVRVENVGAACTADFDCRGAGAMCMVTLGQSSLRFGLPGGYCTAPCMRHAECSPGGGCPLGEIARDPVLAIDITSIVQVPSVCLDRCVASDPSACRTGYVCRSLRDLVPANIRMSPVSALLIGPNFTDTFCIPPVEISLPSSDGGVNGDGGPSITAMDAGS